MLFCFLQLANFDNNYFQKTSLGIQNCFRLMNTTISDKRPWYKIGKLSLYTQKENHSNDLEDRPSSWQVDRGALWRKQKHQDPSLWMFYYFYIYVICRSSLCEWKIMIGRVVVHYDWQSSSLYAQKMSETTILIVPIPSSQFCPSYPSVHSQQ